uniref:Uncharacterized protein n=1 Tax=Strombidium inclinatum TaxID=197538 RepID=A0A7S3N2D0_9SPIT|mmetsp:Transcript_42046/g.64432  ORF Transcript_42046/g.64432 Transcript_42046/m.64432 type:complete len:150 (+) Transcript_42046:274-723(+)
MQAGQMQAAKKKPNDIIKQCREGNASEQQIAQIKANLKQQDASQDRKMLQFEDVRSSLRDFGFEVHRPAFLDNRKNDVYSVRGPLKSFSKVEPTDEEIDFEEEGEALAGLELGKKEHFLLEQNLMKRAKDGAAKAEEAKLGESSESEST